MDLSTIYYTVQDLFQRFSTQRRDLRLYQFNNYLQMANTDLLMSILNMKYNKRSNTERDNEQLDVLQAFVKRHEVTSIGSTHTLPDDFIRCVDEYAYISTSGTIDQYTKLDRVSFREWTDRKNCSITAPSTIYPVFYIKDNTITSDPSDVGAWYFHYYSKYPLGTPPELVFKTEN